MGLAKMKEQALEVSSSLSSEQEEKDDDDEEEKDDQLDPTIQDEMIHKLQALLQPTKCEFQNKGTKLVVVAEIFNDVSIEKRPLVIQTLLADYASELSSSSLTIDAFGTEEEEA